MRQWAEREERGVRGEVGVHQDDEDEAALWCGDCIAVWNMLTKKNKSSKQNKKRKKKEKKQRIKKEKEKL